MFFSRKKREAIDLAKEKEIQSIRAETFEQIDAANKSIVKVNKALSRTKSITGMIYLATHGRRI